jgi:hypothetical protein
MATWVAETCQWPLCNKITSVIPKWICWSFSTLHTLRAIFKHFQIFNRRSGEWADDESNEFWTMWKHGVDFYFGTDAQKHLGASMPTPNSRVCREQIRNDIYSNMTFECYEWQLHPVVLGSKCPINFLSEPRIMSKHVRISWSHWTCQCAGLISSFLFPG